ncbi:hypothetical protein CDD82_7343 [Ophiocordyceps australis]|uniref:O-methyltransferase C-terminal domain-containing protein n=1 Tax=Ophiocordyceps australis TaxID=1399860 RepID=A0A2C5XW37_9HYPO|nr:hypothetical protein CDD82_7343 [Ophiocordyceps australis]
MSLNSTQYEVLAEQIESILRNLENTTAEINDDKIRRRLVIGARKLAVSLEQPRETLRRISHSSFHLPLALVGVESGVFAALATDSRPFNIAELAEKTGVDKGLLKKLLRYYQATDVLSQIDDDMYQSNNVTRALNNQDRANTLRWARKIIAPGALTLPDHLQSNQYKDPTGIFPTAWTSSVPTDKHPYEYLADNPWALKLAQAYMRNQREGRPLFFHVLDFETRFGQKTNSSTILFVDVGGSTGSQCLALRQRYPNLPGRVMIQDRPEVVKQLKGKIDASANIEAEEHDIFTPQPVKGARAYYMRNIFHAWGDATCKDILVNAKAGMNDQSVMLIDEIVLPERGATAQGSEHDIEVMICVGGIERTKAQWESLLNDTGLKILEVVKYDEDYEDSLIIAALN